MSQIYKRVLGVDPGLTRCGVGVVEGAIGSPLTLIGVGVILTPPDAALELRLLQLESELEEDAGPEERYAVGLGFLIHSGVFRASKFPRISPITTV